MEGEREAGQAGRQAGSEREKDGEGEGREEGRERRTARVRQGGRVRSSTQQARARGEKGSTE